MHSNQQPCFSQVTAADDCQEPWRRATQPQVRRAKPAPTPVPALLVRPPPPVDQDWDLMFSAVLARLRATAQVDPACPSLADTVLECVDALEKLQRMLKPQQPRTPAGR